MRTVLYASLTANGYFGGATDGRPIVPAVLADFIAQVREAGNAIIGRRTFDLMASAGDGGSALAGVDLVVVSRSAEALPGAEIARTPEAALTLVEEQGHDTALLAGGAATNTAFLRAGLVDELRLNVLPYLSGPSLNVSLDDGRFADARLVGTTTLGDDVVQLRYDLG